MDSELIQGATAQIEYEIQVANNGEKDYHCKNYYLFGTCREESELIKMKPQVFDYLDNTIKLDDDNQGDWTEITKTTYQGETKYGETDPKVIDTGIEQAYKTMTKSNDGNGNEIVQWEIGQKSITNLFSEWYEKKGTIENIRNVKLDHKTILKNEKLNQELEPGKTSEAISLYAKKILSNSDEIDLNNDAEIAEITRSKETGRIPKVVTSHVYDRGEMVTVTPPTGENKNNIIPIIIGVTSLIILGAGIIIIRKKVL